ncbi:SDR family NAD(P)-dependent oxidoreductase [Roseibium porphyridii]|uniref:SDR family NAD(P)-dependent oxidoreductase n=1 Tax=Roseibium porphyridii TaxID=2866279 RepID=A0ABY8EXT3_9HYPH|nr:MULTISPECIES: SDR family NAD(P)-dependent oxidoreductase [Stappiaceae]QFT32547.1 C-factor [Labrenzia sp. THAF82]WFE87878.1 SDR family NAD(P)-dependent oxidoreductase [Roseibium sp. KMA01]
MPACLITATNRGIGYELARTALAKGWTVFGSARAPAAADETAKSLGEGFVPLVFDVTDHDSVQKSADMLSDKIDLLINNAGVIGPQRQSPLDMDMIGFSETIAVNTIAPLAVSHAFLPHLRQSGAGRILTISSQMSWMGYRKSDRLAYRASKAAVNKVMQGLATELEAEGIPVALIDPGWVRTDMGGASADNCPKDVADGVFKIADSLSIAETGKFFKWTGEERPF